MNSKLVYIFLFILLIISIIGFIISTITENKLNNYCVEKGYYGSYIKQESQFSLKDYFCIMNKGDNYLSKDALYIGTYKDFKEMVE